MKQEETRQKLINSTIEVIAREGLDNATTKQISTTAGLNEAYIYRCFSGKEELFAKVFSSLDQELLDQTLEYVTIMYRTGMDRESRWRAYFFAIWNFLLGNRDKCLTFVRYFYSPYFTKNSAQEHQQRYANLLEQIRPAYKDEADVWMILCHIRNVMLDFAVKVHNGQMPNDTNFAEHVFRVIYRSVEQYFR